MVHMHWRPVVRSLEESSNKDVKGCAEKNRPVIAIYKPKGMVTTLSEAPNQVGSGVSLAAWLRDIAPGLQPIGRLDKDTTGLLLAAPRDKAQAVNLAVCRPRTCVKRYVCCSDQPLSCRALKWLRSGVSLEEGLLVPLRAEVLQDDKAPLAMRSLLDRYYPAIVQWHFILLELDVGWNQVVRRTMRQIGFRLVHLHRQSIHEICLDDIGLLKPGTHVELSSALLSSLLAQCGNKSKMVQGSQVKAGTELYATTEANVFKSAGSWKVVDVLRKGQIMEAAGSPVLVEGYKMLPIRPAGAVYLDETAIWLSDSDSGISEDLAGSESVEDCSSKVPSSANPEEEALAALLKFVAKQGGNANSSTMGSFYEEYPSHKSVIGKKFRKFCDRHSHALQFKDIGNGNFILSSSTRAHTWEGRRNEEKTIHSSNKVPSSANPEEEQALTALLNFVAKQGGNVISTTMGSFYEEYPLYKSVIGKFRNFCDTHSHALQYKDIGNGNFILSSSTRAHIWEGRKKTFRSSNKVPSSANPEEEQALAALLNFVANQGGNVNSSKIGSFYDEYPSHKTVIGKFRTFCNTHSHALQYKDIGNGNFILSSSSASEDDPTSSTTSGEDSGSDRQCIPPHEKALQVVASLRDLSKASRRRVETAASRILAAFPAHARLHCTKGPKNLGIYRAHLCPRGRRCEWGMRCTFAHNSQELLQVSPVRRLEIAITTMRSLCKTVPQ